ncbi:MAG TPA: type II secretion system F family protein [Methylophilus sp.]
MTIDSNFIFFCVLAFIAIFFAMEGFYYWWITSHGQEAKRIKNRLEAINNTTFGSVSHESILKNRYAENASVANQFLLNLPFGKKVEMLLMQSGKHWTLSKLVQYCSYFFAASFFVLFVLRVNIVVAIVIALVVSSLPLISTLRARAKRFSMIEEQLPDAIDAICRSLRSGHAFTSAFGLVADELPDPIATEFRITLEENNLGVNINDAMQNLAQRVPITDLRYFIIAVLIQRETGGNLAEILDSISTIIRERFKLIGHIRVLSAEGKMSAWILGLLPIAIMAVLSLVAPKYLSTLFTNPDGRKLLMYSAILMICGILWMRKIIKIRI